MMAGLLNFTPSVYEHAASLIGKTPLQVSQDPDLLYNAHSTAFGLYQHSPIVIGIDIYNPEAEAYGAKVSTPGGNDIPAICKYPVQRIEDIIRLRPLNPKKDGRIPMIIETGERLAKKFPEADVRIPVSGPFSLAGNLIGFENLLTNLIEDPGSVHEALTWIAHGQIEFSREIISHGLGVAFFESGATPPLLSPEMFAEAELPALKFIISQVSFLSGHTVPCIIGGNTAPIIHLLMETHPGYVICPSETDQDLFMREIQKYRDVIVRINMSPEVFLPGNLNSAFREADRVMALAEQIEKARIGSGVLPFEADPEIVLRIKDFVEMKKMQAAF